MINRGNHVAAFRKEELEKLVETLKLVQRETEPPSADSLVTLINEPDIDIGGVHNYRINNTVNGLSPDQMLSIAGLLNWDPGLDHLADGQLTDAWLWADTEPSI